MDWHKYEAEKRKLYDLNLSPQEYDQRIREILNSLEGKSKRKTDTVTTSAREEYQDQIRQEYYGKIQEEYQRQVAQEYYEQLTLFDLMEMEENKQR